LYYSSACQRAVSALLIAWKSLEAGMPRTNAHSIKKHFCRFGNQPLLSNLDLLLSLLLSLHTADKMACRFFIFFFTVLVGAAAVANGQAYGGTMQDAVGLYLQP